MPNPSETSASLAARELERGQAFEAEGQFDAALQAFANAIAALEAQSSRGVAEQRLLGLAWMNRGNTLQHRGDPAQLPDAIRAYDEAIAHLIQLPLETEPLFRNHAGAAWLNRGHALMAVDAAAGIDSFERAIAEFAQLPLEADPYFRLNLAGAWTNLANAQLAIDPMRARAAAHQTLEVVAEVEGGHEAFGAMSLRARRVRVLAVAELLPRVENLAARTELASEATDAVDDGLALARQFETQGTTNLRPLAARLFRLGAQLYGGHQPHFLGEFVLEQLEFPAFGADAEFVAIAREAVDATLARLQQSQLFIAGTPASDKRLAASQSLRAARAQLSNFPPPPASLA